MTSNPHAIALATTAALSQAATIQIVNGTQTINNSFTTLFSSTNSGIASLNLSGSFIAGATGISWLHAAAK